jgi:hypothetical protein
MGTAYQPKIVTDELVFMYDTGSGKSYKGEPTTNTAVTTGMAAYWNNSGTAAWSSNDTNVPRIFTNLPVFSMEKLTDGNSHIGIGSTSATVSTEYTYSVYVWIPSSNSVNMAGSSPYFRPQPANASVGNLTYEGSAAWGTWPRDQWVRVSRTATTQATNVTSAYISCYLNTAGDKIYFTAPQFEQKGHLTPFVDGTRSATAGLLDLTKNATIDLTNMSFDSNAQMTFDGTDDSFQIAAPGVSASTGFSIELIIKPDNPASAPMVITPNSGGIDHFVRFSSNGNLYLRMIVAADSTTQDFITSTQLSSGDYHHVVFSFNQSDGGKAYYNGTLEHSAAANFTALDWTSYWSVGQRGNNTFFYQGDIPIFKIYNRALTAEEVLQNFNATKDRFIR